MTAQALSAAEVVIGFREIGCELTTSGGGLYFGLINKKEGEQAHKKFLVLCEAVNNPNTRREVVEILPRG
jgi:hypothetical protein